MVLVYGGFAFLGLGLNFLYILLTYLIFCPLEIKSLGVLEAMCPKPHFFLFYIATSFHCFRF